MIKYEKYIMSPPPDLRPTTLVLEPPALAVHRSPERLSEATNVYPQPQSLLALIGLISEMQIRGEHVTSLAGGLPPENRLDVIWHDHYPAIVANLSQAISTKEALQYAAATGNQRLRSWAAEDISRLTRVNVDQKRILTVPGLQYGLSEALLTFCASEHKVALTQTPTYSAFLEAATTPIDIPVFSVESDEQGMIPESLEATILLLKEKNIEPGLVYGMVIGNPNGCVMSDERGRRLNEICKKYGLPFFVDYAYYKLALSTINQPTPKIDYLDDNVILGFTTSKLGSPGGRVGYMAVPNDVWYALLKNTKQAQMIHSPQPNELIFWHLATRPDFDTTIQDLVKVYEAGIDAGMRAVQKNSDIFTTQRPGGGMFLWVKVPDGISTYEHLGRILHEHKIAYSPGIWSQPPQVQLPDGTIVGSKLDDTYMRLCVVTEAPEAVEQAIDQLADAFREIARTSGVPLFS